MKDFGYANGWGLKIPPEVKLCIELGHPVLERKHPDFKCVVVRYCAECNYKYRIDSSD